MSPTKEAKGPSLPVVNAENSVIDHLSSGAKDGNPTVERIVSVSGVPRGDSQSRIAGTNEFTSDKKTECLDVKKLDVSDNGARLNASNDVHLNIRLPNGVSLQEKFSATTTLGIIKDYVDRNQGSGIGSYDLAIPYPRKVFCNEDMGRSLSQLGLFNRQALIVVPHQGATNYHKGGSSLYQTTNTSSSNVNEGGYFASVRRILSYINPLAYLHGPNPALQNNLARAEGSHSPNQGSSSTGRNDDSGRQTTTSRYGSNIHTLKLEDDARFGDRNSFWNGNSTQYGGNNDGQ
uniref:Uncharacterized protein MANES_11G115700 n=1 Tax=Rhizophora mucronata TaxID=61149 RepID=A0A2P2KIL3_RHIMU